MYGRIKSDYIKEFNNWLMSMGCLFHFSDEGGYYKVRLNNSSFLSSYTLNLNDQFRTMIETFWDARNIKIMWNNTGCIFWGCEK